MGARHRTEIDRAASKTCRAGSRLNSRPAPAPTSTVPWLRPGKARRRALLASLTPRWTRTSRGELARQLGVALRVLLKVRPRPIPRAWTTPARARHGQPTNGPMPMRPQDVESQRCPIRRCPGHRRWQPSRQCATGRHDAGLWPRTEIGRCRRDSADRRPAEPPATQCKVAMPLHPREVHAA
eukprot:89533-Pyramimonas_sp.AAC.1